MIKKKGEILRDLYKQAKANRYVLTQEEFAGAKIGRNWKILCATWL